jgi:hypothetical protein
VAFRVSAHADFVEAVPQIRHRGEQLERARERADGIFGVTSNDEDLLHFEVAQTFHYLF